MTLVIELTMDNAAFGDSAGLEASRIIQGLADTLRNTVELDKHMSGHLRDVNGNRVGEWHVDDNSDNP